ncbi:MAG: ADP-ribosylglycohydrolase family protein [Phycisphaeraceae bacterium]
MPGWDSYRQLVKDEFAQAAEEGRDVKRVEALRGEYEAAGDDEAKLLAVWGKMLALPIRADFPFVEPSDWAGIRAARPAGEHRLAGFDERTLDDKLYGAWLGRCCGCALGKPVEGFMGSHNGMSSRERIGTYLKAIGPNEYPLNDYFLQHSPAEERTGKVGCYPSTREQIAYMESDDDIRYTVIGQIVLRDRGRDFTSWDVAAAWMQYLPYRFVCTAETQAYRNVVMRYSIRYDRPVDDNTIDWNWVATHENPYRELIGADIRVDSWGYAAPGNPELAAEFAWRDARISHVKNGIYGAMFMAAMIAAAFAGDDPMAIVEAGLREIPEKSRLHVEMRQVIDICKKYDCDPRKFEAVHEEIYGLLGHYHAVHTNNNAALVVAALLLGGHDFEKVITIAVMGGWDSDCTGATSGSIAGAMLGAKRLPTKWTGRLNDKLMSQVDGYHPIAISECASRSAEIARKIKAWA